MTGSMTEIRQAFCAVVKDLFDKYGATLHIMVFISHLSLMFGGRVVWSNSEDRGSIQRW